MALASFFANTPILPSKPFSSGSNTLYAASLMRSFTKNQARGISPYEEGPTPSDRGHENPIDGNECCDQLSSDHCAREDRRRPVDQKALPGARDEDREMTGDRQLEIHERLDHFAAEMEDPFPQIKKPEGSKDAGDAQDVATPSTKCIFQASGRFAYRTRS